MKRLLLIIGDDIKNNSALLAYIFEEYSKKFSSLDDIYFTNKEDKNFLNKLQSLDEYKYISVFTSQENSVFLARFLATLCDDNLKLYENGFMALFNAKRISENSYISQYKESFINVIRVESGEKIEELSLEKASSSFSFYFFGEDDEKFQASLAKLAFKSTQARISKYLLFVKIYNIDKASSLTKFLKAFQKDIILEKSIYALVLKRLKELEASITFLEDGSSGFLAKNFSSLQGSEEVFQAALLVSGKEIKNTWLGMRKDFLAKHGEVSRESIAKMLDSVLDLSGASFALAISSNKEGIFYLGAAQRDAGKIIEKFEFFGSSTYQKEQACLNAFSLLLLLRKDLFLA